MNTPSDLYGVGQKKSLYAKREPVFPKAVDGRFRRFKWLVMVITLAIYYVTPWLRWDRGTGNPDQAVLIDLANRRFYFGSIEIWPHEFYYVAGLLIMAGVGLFLVTSAVGRAWCGYACPQTVWTDLFQHIERFIDGDRNAQAKLAKAPRSIGKVARRAVKYAIFLLVSLATGGAWIFYFADAPTLANDFLTGQAATVAYATVAVLTATTFIFGGFMREQVCIYMCPWPRIQTAMMDEKTLMVTYKDWRGEPRGRGRRPAELSDVGTTVNLGDCINCNQCVAVCPTGIDIREGPQIGCITCALCIDACDSVMAKIGKPRGLIDYATLDDCKAEAAGAEPRPVWKTVLRPRTLACFLLWGSIGLTMVVALGERTRMSISAQHQRNPAWVQLSDGHVRNNFTVKLRNMELTPRVFEVRVDGLEGGVLWTEGGSRESAASVVRTVVPANSLSKLSVFVMAPGEGETSDPITFTARTRSAGKLEVDVTEANFERPGR